MKLRQQLKTSFVNELRFVSKSMKAVQNPAEKLYLFSATYGAAYQIMNIEFDAELSFLNQVLGSAYATMNNSLNQIKSGQLISTFTPNLFPRLESQIDVLADLIEADKPCYEALQEIGKLAYSTTGNGHYLFLKGALTI